MRTITGINFWYDDPTYDKCICAMAESRVRSIFDYVICPMSVVKCHTIKLDFHADYDYDDGPNINYGLNKQPN